MSNISNISEVNVSTSSAKLDGIQFNSIQRGGYNSTTRYVLVNTPWSTLDTNTPLKPAVNAVDIDWNAAVIPYGNLETGESTTVNSTGELLSLISRMQQEIFELSATVTALNDNAVTKGSDGSMAKVTINFDGTCKTVSINGNVCNSGDVNYYRVGTVLDFVATPIDDYVNAAWYSEWRVNKLKENISYTYSSEVNKSDKFSLLVDTTDNITVNAYITIIVD